VKIDLEEAIAALNDARHDDIDEAVANALYRVGAAYLQRNRPGDAFEPLDEARYLCGKLENRIGGAHVNLALGQVAGAKGQAEEAESLCRQALAVFEEDADDSGKVKTLEFLSQVLYALGRKDEAVDALEQALALTEKADDKVGQILFKQYLAPLYRDLERLEDALAAYRALGRLTHEAGDHQRTALAAVGVGTMLAALERNEEAVQAFEEARDIFTNLGQLQRASQVEAEMAQLGKGND
jgi:tetratricopeptide (TPR) repeat protein